MEKSDVLLLSYVQQTISSEKMNCKSCIHYETDEKVGQLYCFISSHDPNKSGCEYQYNIEYLDEFNRRCNSEDYTKGYIARKELVEQYAWAIPNGEALNEIRKYSPIVEIGAGNGYWGFLLQKLGVDYTGYDYVKPSENVYTNGKPFIDIKLDSYDVLCDFEEKYNLFLCWPDYDTMFAYRTLKRFNGNHILYIGENEGGCTANDDFFVLLKKQYNLTKRVFIPQYYAIHDSLQIWSRK